MDNKKLLTKLYLISPDHIKVNEFPKVLEEVLKTGFHMESVAKSHILSLLIRGSSFRIFRRPWG